MPTNKEIASELWLHVNSPEAIDKLVGDRMAQLRRDARSDELTDFQNERKEIDDAVEKYLNSPVFENYKQAFRDIDDRDSPELVQAVSDMTSQLGNEISDSERERHMNQIATDLSSLDQAIEQDLSREDHQHER